MTFLTNTWKGIVYRFRTWKLTRKLGVPKMHWTELSRRQGEITVVDVREPEEYEVSHLAGCLHIPFKQVKADPGVLQQVPKDKPVVTYCTIGFRSGVVASKLIEAGYTDVYNLGGSLINWFNVGGTVVKEGEEVHRIHPFNDEWGQYITRPMS